MTAAPRLGSVPYLNAAPLIRGLDPAPRLLVPALLSEELFAGRLDAALVPLAEYLLHAEAYSLVDDVAIAARGAVHSVILATGKPLPEISTVALDPDSRTSVLLTRVLLEVWQERKIEYVPPGAEADARVIIGDPAIAWRKANPGSPVLDLGALWTEWTGLPFVFAAWAVRKEAASPALGDILREAKRRGVAARKEIAKDEAEYRYLTESIRYDLGPDEKAGIFRFSGYLRELGLIGKPPTIDWI